MTNKEIAKKLYENENISFGMIDKPNIVITNGTINYDNGSCDEYNKNAITIYAKDLNGLFKFGMILKGSSAGIQTISQDYIEFLLENNGLSREDCLSFIETAIWKGIK